jgi:hypothetical protein
MVNLTTLKSQLQSAIELEFDEQDLELEWDDATEL